MKKLITAQGIYDALLNDDKIYTKKGCIRFELNDVNIIVRQKDVVGNIIQEWLQGWLDARGYDYRHGESTQMPPDFFLSPNDKTKNLLEVKAYYASRAPAFDIADFRSYASELLEKPYMLDVDYLVFAYDMSPAGTVTIKKVFMQKVWKITRAMESKKTGMWPLTLQIKEGRVHKIRPGKWTGKTTKFPLYACKEDYLAALEECIFKNTETHAIAAKWRDSFIAAYQKVSGVKLTIPRWTDIADKYLV